jgi:hypothetical protein
MGFCNVKRGISSQYPVSEKYLLADFLNNAVEVLRVLVTSMPKKTAVTGSLGAIAKTTVVRVSILLFRWVSRADRTCMRAF